VPFHRKQSRPAYGIRIQNNKDVASGSRTQNRDTKANKESESEKGSVPGCIQITLKGSLEDCIGSVAYYPLPLCLNTPRTGSEFSCCVCSASFTVVTVLGD